MQKRVAAATVVMLWWLAATAAAQGQSSLGRAGPFRMVGGTNCPAGLPAQLRGDCDPGQVDRGLPPNEQSQAHVERALKLLSLLRTQAARLALDAAIAADPCNIEAIRLRARFNIPGNLASAHADINAGLLLSPGDADLLATRAYLLRSRRDLEQALDDANAAVRSDPQHADARWIRSLILMDIGQYEAADEDLSRTLALEPDHPQAHMIRANIRVRQSRFDDAVADATAAMERSSSRAAALQIRVAARVAMGQHAAAIDDLTALLGPPGTSGTPQMPAATLARLAMLRASLLVQAGRKDEAVGDLDLIAEVGGTQAILSMQRHLRQHGFPDVPLDGKRSQLFDDALRACFSGQACGRGVTAHH